jgi:tetratricopeptide (TPR) repeat protein
MSHKPTHVAQFKIPVIVFAIALVARLAYLIEVSSTTVFSNLIADSRFYDLWAKSIAGGAFLPDAALYRPPLYAYILAFNHAVSGSSHFFACVIQILLGSLSCVLICLIVRQFFEERIAVVAGIIAALHGLFVFLDSELLPSTVVTFLLLASIHTLATADKSSRLRRFFVAGALVGLASLAQPMILVAIPLLLVWQMIVSKGQARIAVKRWGIILAGVVIVIAPVTAHNVAHSGGMAIVSTDYGISFFAGNNVSSDGKTTHLPGFDPEIMRDSKAAEAVAERIAREDLSPSGVSGFYMGQALLFLESMPGKAAALTLKRLYMLLNGYEIGTETSIYFQRSYSAILSFFVWDFGVSFPDGILLPLGLIGLVLTFRQWRRLSLLYALVLSLSVAPLMFSVNMQTRAQLIAFAVIFASVGFLAMLDMVRRRESSKLVVYISLLLVLLLFCNYDLVALKDNMSASYIRLGSSLWDEGKIGEAETVYLSGLDRNPDSPILLNSLGNVYFKRGVYQEAEKKYMRAISIKPDYQDARKNVIRLWERWGKKEVLYDAFREFLRFYPESDWGLDRMAGYFADQGTDDSALVYYDKLLRLYPNNGNARFALSGLYVKQARSEDARKILEELVRLSPEDPKLHLNLGIAYAQLGKYNLALEEFTTVLYYDSSNVYATYNLGRVYEALGDTVLATNLFYKILAIDPNFYQNPGAILDSALAAGRREGISP